MTSAFSQKVEASVGPLLRKLGFALDATDDSPDAGGLDRSIAFYRSPDCKLQIFYSQREGETNCMIAPLNAVNQFGSDAEDWFYINHFSRPPDIPPQERLRLAIAEVQSYDNRLDWVRDRLAKHYQAARSGILAMYETKPG